MSKRKFFFASLALVMFAMGFQGAAHAHFTQTFGLRASIFRLPESERAAATVAVDRMLANASLLGRMGLSLAFASLTCLLLSDRHQEPAWRPLPIVMLLGYLLLHLVMT